MMVSMSYQCPCHQMKWTHFYNYHKDVRAGTGKYLHHLHGHILHNLSNIAIYGKNLFLALTDLLIRKLPEELNLE